MESSRVNFLTLIKISWRLLMQSKIIWETATYTGIAWEYAKEENQDGMIVRKCDSVQLFLKIPLQYKHRGRWGVIRGEAVYLGFINRELVVIKHCEINDTV